MEQPNSTRILEVSRVRPSAADHDHDHDFSLPLSVFDLPLFLCTPTQKIFFFSLTTKHPPFQSIISNLKHSLSITLSSFLPLAGNLIWPHDSPQPIILYKPGDTLSLTIAESDADFDRLSKNDIRMVSESRCLVPDLELSDSIAPAMSIQITSFPNNGFSVGFITNHVISDGKTTTMFMKSWASICKLNLLTLSSELTPDFQRTCNMSLIQLEKYFPLFMNSNSDSQVKRFKLPPKVAISENLMTGTFELTRDDLKNLRIKVEPNSNTRHLSNFVLTFAYVSSCMIKAQGIQGENKIALVFLIDWRLRERFQIPVNYFGNGVTSHALFFEAREIEGENTVAIISNKIGNAIVELEEKMKKNTIVEIMEEGFRRWGEEMPVFKSIVVSGSPRFGLYEIDFGWGKCKKVDTVLVNSGGSFSMTDSKKGNGGIDVGIALPNDVMNVFASQFSSQLK